MRQGHTKAINKIIMTSRWKLPKFLQKERKTRRPSQHANLSEIDVVQDFLEPRLFRKPAMPYGSDPNRNALHPVNHRDHGVAMRGALNIDPSRSCQSNSA